jgi:hypothetical protein
MKKLTTKQKTEQFRRAHYALQLLVYDLGEMIHKTHDYKHSNNLFKIMASMSGILNTIGDIYGFDDEIIYPEFLE